MIVLLEVGAGGMLGAPARYVLDQFVSSKTEGAFPWGTFVVNLTGALLLGFIIGLSVHNRLGPEPVALIGTGFCGAYTTFSTFTYETVAMILEGRNRSALYNVGGSLALGLLGAGAGLALAALV
jgi:CrcB protein